MEYTLSAFSEPRGVMRILQFIFSICAFATTANFVLTLTMDCGKSVTHLIDYPFKIGEAICTQTDSNNKTHEYYIPANLSSDAQFYVATGVLSMMYCIFIIAVYAFLDQLYKKKSEIPLADFMLTTVLAIFWLSGSAAWSNSVSTLKAVTDETNLRHACSCNSIYTGSFSGLNISLILGYLNFFLWASDLWFLYKETIWFQGISAAQNSGMHVRSSTPPAI